MTSAPNRMNSSLDALFRTSDQLYDDLLLPDETLKIRAEAREFATTVLAPRAAELNSAEESKAAFPRDILDAMAAAGLYTIPFASDVGGRGLQYPMLAAATLVEIKIKQLEREGKKLSEADKKELKESIRATYERQTDPRYAAARLWVDAIIDPAQTREALIWALEAAALNPEIHQFKTGVLQT